MNSKIVTPTSLRRYVKTAEVFGKCIKLMNMENFSNPKGTVLVNKYVVRHGKLTTVLNNPVVKVGDVVYMDPLYLVWSSGVGIKLEGFFNDIVNEIDDMAGYLTIYINKCMNQRN